MSRLNQPKIFGLLLVVLSSACWAQQVTTITLGTSINADGMAFEADGKLLITSAFDGTTIARVNVETGNVITAVRGINGPIAVAVDAQGNIYNSNWTGNTISRTTPDNITTDWVTIGNRGDGLAFDDNGDLWWTSGVGVVIKKVTPCWRGHRSSKGWNPELPLGHCFGR